MRTRFSLCLLLLVCLVLHAAASRRQTPLPFAPAALYGEWTTYSCGGTEFTLGGTYEIAVAPNRRVSGWLVHEELGIMATIRGTVTRTGILRARLSGMGAMTGVIATTEPLTVSGIINGKCTGTFGPTVTPIITNVIVVVTNITVTNVTSYSPLFRDFNLMVKVGSLLGKPGEQLTSLDMVPLQALNLWSSGVRNLAGLEYALNLWDLDLSSNPVTNYVPLYNLPNLTRLSLGSALNNVTFLTNLTQVQILYANDGLFTDVAPIATMTRLSQLSIARTPVTNAQALGLAPSLYELNLTECGLKSLAGFNALTNLYSLNLYRNSIRDVRPLAGLTNLARLYLTDNPVTNASVLAEMTRLTDLGLARLDLGDISWMEALTNVANLSFSYSQVRDIVPLARMSNLKYLDMYGVPLPDLSPLTSLTNLQTAWVSYTGCSNLTWAAGMRQLTTLYALSNNISDLTPISNCTNLWSLALQENQITTLEPLATCRRLYSLSISDNQLTTLAGIEGLTGLSGLYASGNQITNIAALTNLWSLQYVYLDNNLITDITPLAGLPKLSAVYLYNNPLDLSAANVVQALQARGVSVYTR